MKRSVMNLGILLIAVVFIASCSRREADEVESSKPESQPADAPRSADAPQTIAKQLTDRREASRARVPAETLEIMKGATEELRQSDIIEGALSVGGKIPQFVLNDAVGNTVTSEDLLADGPLVLVFYRGGW